MKSNAHDYIEVKTPLHFSNAILHCHAPDSDSFVQFKVLIWSEESRCSYTYIEHQRHEHRLSSVAVNRYYKILRVGRRPLHIPPRLPCLPSLALGQHLNITVARVNCRMGRQNGKMLWVLKHGQPQDNSYECPGLILLQIWYFTQNSH